MSDMVQKLIGADGNVILSLESGGTSAADAAGARANLVVPMRPKLLWSGSALAGSTLTAAGIAQYSVLLAVFSIYGAAVPAILYNNVNNSVTGWAANTIVENSVRYNRFVAARLNISDESAFVSDIFTTVTYTGGSNVSTEGGATSYPLTALYGMTLKSDIQEA